MRQTRLARAAGARLTLAAALLGCGGDPAGPPPAGGARLAVVSGGGVSDTIGAAAPPLTVELRGGDGRPVSGAALTFVPLRKRTSFAGPQTGVGVYCPPDVETCFASSFTPVARATTDGAGRATINVVLGDGAGTTYLVVAADSAGVRDSVAYAIAPGRAPVRTGGFLGSGYGRDDLLVQVGSRVRVAVRDRAGNARDDVVRVTVTGAAGVASVVDADGSVRGDALGATQLVATLGTAVDTANVTVLPSGRLVGEFLVQARPTPFVRVAAFNLDGSDVVDLGIGGSPAWAPDGKWVVYGVTPTGLTLADAAGTGASPLVASPQLVSQGRGRFSRDGAFVYFGGRTAARPSAIYRATAADGGVELVGAASDSAYDPEPDPHPDGRRLVFVGDSARALRVLDVAAGTSTPLGVSGAAPRWDAAGARVVYVSGSAVWAVGLDGSAARRLSPATIAVTRFALSPDGAWLVVQCSALPGSPVGSAPSFGHGLCLVDVAAATSRYLSYSFSMSSPSWL